LVFGAWSRPPTPQPQNPNPQSPIPKEIIIFKILNNEIYYI